MHHQHHAAALMNFKKAQSLLGKMIDMLEADTYCIDVMQQNLAVIGMLKSAHQTLMEGHLHSCFSNAVASRNGKRKAEMVEEILKVTKLASK
jgi:DNA-binding FrmR family transcriptional regulator